VCGGLFSHTHTQHVTVSTREKAILDLVLTSRSDILDEVEVLGQFGTSDHKMLSWHVTASTSRIGRNSEVPDYRRADFDGMRQELRDMSWSQLGEGSVEDGWSNFKDSLLQLERKYVPNKKLGGSGRHKAVWLTHKALRFIKRRRKVYAKYKR